MSTAGATDRPVCVLRVAGLYKRFGATEALRGVDFEVRSGEIHALLGSNGAGKSTLIRILAGVETADRGTLTFHNDVLDARRLTTDLAHRKGLRVVHQQDSTFPSLTVAENLAARDGFVVGFAGRVKWRAVRRRTQELLDRFDIDARPDDDVDRLRPVGRRMLAIARALADREDVDAGVLVLDEPTAGLPRPEVLLLQQALRRYAAAGQAIVYVTHLLDELPGFADRATVLRDGRVVGTADGPELTEDRLVELICGRPLVRVEHGRATPAPGQPALELRRLRGGPVDGVDLHVDRGEIVGLAGITGSGRSSILQMAFGVARPTAGEVLIDGEPRRWSAGRPDPRIGYVPEDRSRDAAFAALTVRENLSAARVKSFAPRVRLRHDLESAWAGSTLRRFGIRASSPDAPFGALSGGNQQRVILARWIERRPHVLLLDEPSGGVDVRARADIHRMILAAAEAGCAILLASSDAGELSEVCHRVVTLVRGRSVGELSGTHLQPASIEELAHRGGPRAAN